MSRTGGTNTGPDGTLGASILRRLKELFRVHEHVDKVHEIALLRVLVVHGSRKIGGAQSMIGVQ